MYDMYTLYRDITETITIIENGQFDQAIGIADYEKRIESLGGYAKKLEQLGYDEETIAHVVYDRRISLTRHFLEETPEIVHLYFDDFIHKDYGTIGTPSFDFLKQRMDFSEIISYCSRINYDIEKLFRVDQFMPWLEKKLFTLYR